MGSCCTQPSTLTGDVSPNVKEVEESNSSEILDDLFAADNIVSVNYCKERVMKALDVYSKWIGCIARNDETKEDIPDIFDLINDGIHVNYSVNKLLADFNRLTENEEILGFYNEKEDEQKDDELMCDADCCFILNRQRRPRDGRTESTLFLVHDKDDEESAMRSIAIQQCLDSIHCFVHHDLRLNIREIGQQVLKQKMMNDDDENDNLCYDYMSTEIGNISQRATMTSSRFRTHTVDQKYDKFTTDAHGTNESRDGNCGLGNCDGIPCFMELIATDLSNQGMSNQGLTILMQFIKDEKFETDSFIENYEDDEINDEAEHYELSLKYILNMVLKTETIPQRTVSEIIDHLIMKRRSQQMQYSSSLRMFYWPFYAKNEAEYNSVYKKGSVSTLEGNHGYRLCDWYIESKYKDFKTEMVSNPLSGVSMRIWNETLQKAKIKLAAYRQDSRRRQLICVHPHWERLYNIQIGEEATISHILALLFYTNMTKASFEFSASFRRAFWNETDTSLKGRHSAFVHQARLLRELVEAFGNRMKRCSVSIFYHGVSRDLVFEGTRFKLFGPLSTTSGTLMSHQIL